MSLTKHATFQVLAAQYARAGSPRLRVQGHKAEFDYEPRPGFLYVRSRAISSRTNDNFDAFPAEELKKGYRSFIGKPTFVNHHNADHRRARGVIIDAALHEDFNPDGSPDSWVECLHEIDAIHFPKLAQAIVKGHIGRTSMGVDVAFSVCSVCGNKASNPLEYCRHIPAMKGQRVYKTDQKTGAKTGVLVYESCYGLSFFENSLLVEEPADPTAFVLGEPVLGAGVAEALGVRTSARNTSVDYHASKIAHLRYTMAPAGVLCEDCVAQGEDVPASYILTTSGIAVCDSHLEIRDGESEDRMSRPEWYGLPPGWHESSKTASKTAKVYRNVPCSGCSIPLKVDTTALTVTATIPSNGIQGRRFVPAHEATADAWLDTSTKEDVIYWDCPACSYADSLDLTLVGPRDYTGAKTARQFYDREGNPSDVFVPMGVMDMDPASAYVGTTPVQTRDLKPGMVLRWFDGIVPTVKIVSVTPAQQYGLSNVLIDTGWDMQFQPDDKIWHVEGGATASRHKALLPGEVEIKTVAPTQIDTLRESACPICGEENSWDGEKCQVCGFIAPPDAFGDPDVEKAQQVDLRQDKDEATGGTLKCDSCGATFPAAPTSKVAIVLPQDPDADDEATTGPAVTDGGTCPACGTGTLHLVDSGDSEGFLPAGSAAGASDPQFLPAGSAGTTVASRRRFSKVASRRDAAHVEGEDVDMPRPALVALAEQQQIIMRQGAKIRALSSVVTLIAKAAGIDAHPLVRQAMRVVADDQENPGSPVGWAIPSDSPATTSPSESTDQAKTPAATDDPTSIGASPLTDVAPAAKDDPTVIGGTISAPLSLSDTDVTEPVSGTDGEGAGVAGTNKIETDVRIGNPDNPQTAFDDPGFLNAQSSRVMAGLRLARLRIEAGIATGDDLALGQTIASDRTLSDEAIRTQIDTLVQVAQVRPTNPAAPRRLVPRQAGRAPSLAGGSAPMPPVVGSVSPEELVFE